MESLLDEIREKYPFVKIWAFESSNRIELQKIEIPFEHRGKGIGTDIIKRLQKYAQLVGKPIVLRPEAERGRKKDLERFYKGLGFVNNRGRNMDYSLSRTMYWRFKEWLCLSEGLKIIHIDPEEDWEYGDQAYQIARMVNIRPSRNKNPTIIALNDKEEVIGAAFTSWEDDHDASSQAREPIARWDFDIVVHPSWQGYEMVGMKLIRQAELERKNLEFQYDQKAYTRTWVVNPRLARILQTPRYGYTADSEYEDGSAHLTKYEGVISGVFWKQEGQGDKFVIRRSDGRYYSPTQNTNWRWHKDIRQAYIYHASRLPHVKQELESIHRDNWKYDKKTLENEIFAVVFIGDSKYEGVISGGYNEF